MQRKMSRCQTSQLKIFHPLMCAITREGIKTLSKQVYFQPLRVCFTPLWHHSRTAIWHSVCQSTYNKWPKSSLVRFLGHDFVDGPPLRRAFWADSAPLIDMGRLVVIRGNYRGTRLLSGEKADTAPRFGQILTFSPDYNLNPRYFM